MSPPASLFSRLPIPVVFVSSDSQVALANERGRALLNLPSGEVPPAVVVPAIARLLPDLGHHAPMSGNSGDYELPYTEASIGARRYRIQRCRIDDQEMSGVAWLFHEAAGADPPPPPEISPLLKAAVDCLDEGFMLIDQDDRICLWNNAFLDMLDLPAELIVHGAPVRPLARILADRGDYGPGDPAALADQINENIRNRMTARGERQMANGRIVEAEWLLVAGGYFMFRLRNVTSERTASQFKDELIATVSHELRTPLTAIIGSLGLLKGGVGGQAEPQVARLIEVASKNSERLTRLVDDLLDIDRLQADTLDFHFERSDIGRLLASAVEQNMPYAQGMNIAIDLDVSDHRVFAEVDRGRLQQVMGNLLSNAAKFSPGGSRVRVQLRPTAAGVRISVMDRGRGMSAEFCRRLFTRFAQENRISENGQAGTGLGLAICKSIVDRHGGRIHVDTQEGVGTIFNVDLPYEQEPATIA